MRQITPRLGRTMIVVLVALAGFGAYRSLRATGYFAAQPQPTGLCRPMTALEGMGDIALDSLGNMLFLAGGDGISALSLADPKAAPQRLKGTPSDFHPRAISLYRGPDGTSLMAINAKSDGRLAVDIFTVTYESGAPRLAFASAIEGGLLTSGSDIAAVAPNRFYLSNSFGSQSDVMRSVEKALVLPLSNILYFDGMAFRVAVDRVALPSAVAVRRDQIYAASGGERRLLAFNRDPFRGTLTELASLQLPIRADKIVADGDSLLVAGVTQDAGASQVLRVWLDDKGAPQSYQPVYAGAASATAALRAGGQIAIAGAGLACQP